MTFQDYQKLIINGEHLSGKEIIDFCGKSERKNIQALGEFIKEWLSDDPKIQVKTSGSTGIPKLIDIEKNQMLASAAATAQFFGFEEEQTALLCLPISYIAGKMMVVRALLCQLNLICIEPCHAPLSLIEKETVIDFAPLTPMQLKDTVDTYAVQKILLGGGPVSPDMEGAFQKLNAAIYLGYGMTETLSHVALRRLNGSEKSDIYHALPEVFFQLDERNCLVIQVPFLNEPVVTNDWVELVNNQSFIWKGRVDNIINSGGLKFFPEEIEKMLFPLIPERFFVAGVLDETLGEKLCLFIEAESYPAKQMEILNHQMISVLSRYEKPKEVFFIQQFVMTESGKIKRKECIRLRH